MNQVELTVDALVVGDNYKWKSNDALLEYTGPAKYPGDSRTWHTFKKVSEPKSGGIWCEVLPEDLKYIESVSLQERAGE